MLIKLPPRALILTANLFVLFIYLHHRFWLDVYLEFSHILRLYLYNYLGSPYKVYLAYLDNLIWTTADFIKVCNGGCQHEQR